MSRPMQRKTSRHRRPSEDQACSLAQHACFAFSHTAPQRASYVDTVYSNSGPFPGGGWLERLTTMTLPSVRCSAMPEGGSSLPAVTSQVPIEPRDKVYAL